jgi:hypothetical protein
MGIATRCGSGLRTGSVVAKLMAIDFGTLMFTMERGRDIPEVSTISLFCFAFRAMLLPGLI